MKLIVFSPENHDPREAEVVPRLIAAGLEWYHLRKPSWSDSQRQQWIESLPAACRPRIRIHPRGCSAHTLAELSATIGKRDYVFFSPVFPSISKPGYGPAAFDRAELTRMLSGSPAFARLRRGKRAVGRSGSGTEVYALGGITAENAPQCRELGFDGVALLGAVWESADPVAAYAECRGRVLLDPPRAQQDCARTRFRKVQVMCITQDAIPLSHVEQTRQLCAAGAQWIQLRRKSASHADWLSTAREVVPICREAGALCMINDSVEIALASGADGVHLGKGDGEWADARKRLGPGRIIGGTVNDSADARRASAAGCLDYVGVGPLRFTTTKKKLSPVLGLDGIRNLLPELGGLPAWVIGGVMPSDLPAIREIGAAGVAVSSSLFSGGTVAENLQAFSDESPGRLRRRQGRVNLPASATQSSRA